MDKTEFSDKSGKPLYIGDIIQWRLGKFGKSGGPTLHKVIRTKKGVKLVNPDSNGPEGMLLRKSDEQYISLFDSSHRQ